MLELLAQQEMESEEYKQALIKIYSKLKNKDVNEMFSKIKHKVEVKYGTYIEFR